MSAGERKLGTMHSVRRTAVLVLVIGGLAAAVLAGCGKTTSTITGANGQKTTVTKTSAPKTKFILHAGLAYFAFHRYLWEPYKAGDLKHPLDHKLTLAKAGIASLFVYHELKEASVDVKSSKLLSKLFSPLIAVSHKLSSLKSDLLSGNTNAVQSIQNDLGSIKNQAGSLGASINPVHSNIPGMPGI
jgi:hypothetical protein